MTTRAQLVAAARSWVGVPTFHHGRDRAGGVDCLGLILGVAEATGYPGAIVIPPYGRLPSSSVLIEAMDAHMLPIPAVARAGIDGADYTAGDLDERPAAFDGLADGDVIGLSWGARDLPMHLAIAATFDCRRTIVHASPLDKRVLEVTLGGKWAASVCCAWRFPNLVGV